jgi:hypothetical protein
MDLAVRRAPAPPVDTTVPTPADALHRRVSPAHVIDLREGGAISMGASITRVPPSHNMAVTHPPNHTHATPPSSAHERHIRRFSDRFERARKMSRSAQISKWGTDSFGNIQDPDKMYDKFGNPTLHTLTHEGAAAPHAQAVHAAPHHPPLAPSAALPEMPHLAATQHEAMTQLPKTTPPATPAPAPGPAAVQNEWRPHLGLSPHRSTLATVAAVAVMGGYIWLQNYPKLAIQAADSKAGVAATLPGYVPSSYNLDHTDSTSGLVTLNFTSPSVPDTLKIAEHRTTWDSSSLLDNYVAKHTDDYGTVQGQGLTIYLFNNNQAAWVNHGIWYSIEGASRLSREQILKIAFSL